MVEAIEFVGKDILGHDRQVVILPLGQVADFVEEVRIVLQRGSYAERIAR
jgi:hypothetical protein